MPADFLTPVTASVILANSRTWLRYLWAVLLSASGCLWWAKHSLRKQGAVLVLMLHRVLDDAGFGQTHCTADIVVRDKTFADFTRYISRLYEVVPLREAKPGQPSERLRLVLTFDDGWGDNYLHVFPRVRQLKLPLTVFVCSGVLGEVMPFWTEQAASLMKCLRPVPGAAVIDEAIEALKSLPAAQRAARIQQLREQAGEADFGCALDRVLSLPEILAMDQAGVEFGSHTHTHPILTTVSLEEGQEDIQTSKERPWGSRAAYFPIPTGAGRQRCGARCSRRASRLRSRRSRGRGWQAAIPWRSRASTYRRKT